MIEWAILIAIAEISFGALLKFGKLPRLAREPLAAALALAIAGYAMQGRPSVSGSPATATPAKTQAVAAYIAMRADMDKNFSPARQYLILSDAFARQGKYRLGASYIRSGLMRYPYSPDLWAGLAVQLMLANDGKMSPPAQLAFARVRVLSKIHPAPDYFKGLDELFAGRPDQSLMLWRNLLANPPKNAKWPAKLESQVKGLELMIANMAGENKSK
jgi:cytochrome c-type biogenesis protein CcmH